MGQSKLLSEIQGLSNCFVSKYCRLVKNLNMRMKGTFPQYKNMISAPNLFNASHKISRNQGANLNAKNKYLRIQCMKCEGYGQIQAECANTWSDDEYKECNKGDDLCNESWHESIYM